MLLLKVVVADFLRRCFKTFRLMLKASLFEKNNKQTKQLNKQTVHFLNTVTTKSSM